MTYPTHWEKKFEVGDPTIDHQHQELFQLVVLLDQAIAQDPAQVEGIIFFLEDYVQTHFLEEETLMEHHHYEGLSHHHEEHQVFKALVLVLREKFDRKEPVMSIIYAVRQLIDKLVYHIIHVDSGIASLTHHHL